MPVIQQKNSSLSQESCNCLTWICSVQYLRIKSLGLIMFCFPLFLILRIHALLDIYILSCDFLLVNDAIYAFAYTRIFRY